MPSLIAILTLCNATHDTVSLLRRDISWAGRAGPSRCGAQCKTWARGPMQDLGARPSEQWFYGVIVFSQPCYDRGRAQIYSTEL